MSSEETITSPAVILDYLNAISRTSALIRLSVCDDANSKVYESRFQSLKPGNQHIILHQVLPGDWRETISPETQLEIRSCTRLGHVRFTGFLTPLEESGNNPYCKLSFPTTIYRKQERDYFRVSLKKTVATASLQLDTDTLLAGECRDFSMAGAQLALPLSAESLQIGQLLDNCTLVIEDRLELLCRGKICSLQRREKEIIAGMQFLDLTLAQTRQIAAALTKIERQNIHG